ncbi:MAG: hypothetical protein O9353_00865, partial [Bacteroidia bacterium]|nr:hypothetical protein [Bacteroidia bacterium]
IFCHNLNHQILRIENDRCSVFYELSEAERCSDMSLAISEENHLVVVARMPIIFDADGKMIGSYKNHSSAYGFPFHTKKGAIIYHAWGKDSLLEVYKNTITLKPLKWQSKQQRGPLSFFRIQDETYAISNEDKLLYAFDEDSYEFVQLDEQPFIQSSEFLRFYNVNQQLWIAGATAGVQTLEGKNRRTLSAKLYPDFFISSVFKDHEGNILLSTFNQGNLVIPDLDIEDVVTLPQKQSIVSVHADKDLGIVLGSSEGDLISFRGTKFQALSNEGKKPLKSINSWPGFPYVIYDDGKVKAYHKASGRIIPLLENSLKDAALLDTNTIYLALNGGIRKLRHLGSGVFQSEVLEALRIRTYAVEVEAVTRNVFAATSDGLRIIKPDSTIERPVFEGVN